MRVLPSPISEHRTATPHHNTAPQHPHRNVCTKRAPPVRDGHDAPDRVARRPLASKE
ncbi:MAG TPA: hypothetical protein VK453_09625 [Micromonosporaceae bacterium]|nr:hypothetical protein [Micromonosporaceae bacterium]